MKHWMMWTAGLSFVLGVAATGPAIAADKAASKSAASKPAGAPANPTEDWAITAVTKENGGFDYCAAGTRFDNGHALLIARNKADEVILIVGLASDKLKAKSVLPTKLTVDSRETRQSSALVTRPSAMAIAMGKDQGFFESVRHGNVLKIDNAELKLSVSLRGSGKALTDLGACVETEGKSLPKVQTAATPASPAAEVPAQLTASVQAAPSEPTPAPVPAPEPAGAPPVATGAEDPPPTALAPEQLAVLPHPAESMPKAVPLAPASVPAPAPVPAPVPAVPAAVPPGPALPDPLVNLLSAAGMAGVVPVSLDRVPQDQRPATFAWKYGPVFGGIREVSIIDNRNLTELTDAYVEVLRNSCSGQFTSSLGPIEVLREITMRVGEATCALPERTTEFRHLYYLNKARIFTTFIHESDSSTKAMASYARDQLAAVIRRLATTGTTAR
jgi:hypothetical protein